MKITAKTEYALLAVCYLSKTAEKMTLDKIAKDMTIPGKFLEQIMIALKKALIVESIRGAHGGYQMYRRPEDVTVLEILQATEDSLLDIQTRTNPFPKIGMSIDGESVSLESHLHDLTIAELIK